MVFFWQPWLHCYADNCYSLPGSDFAHCLVIITKRLQAFVIDQDLGDYANQRNLKYICITFRVLSFTFGADFHAFALRNFHENYLPRRYNVQSVLRRILLLPSWDFLDCDTRDQDKSATKTILLE